MMLVTSTLASSLAAPAWACGCGAYIPNRAGASVSTERALIAWDGTTEDIVMAFSVSGSSERAAWVMPVPSAAEVSLGNPEAFDELVRLTAPRVEYRDDWRPSFDWLTTAGSAETMAGAPPGAGVKVLGRQRIGPFDVTRLAANDPAVLANWLSDNGFPSPDGLEQNLAPYVADRWELVAIKLAPAEATGTLTGQLQPLTLTFTSDRVIYPMRLSRSAKLPQTVDLYVLADHRMDPSAVPVARDKPALEFAGRLDATTAAPPLQPYLAKGEFLTRWSNSLAQPDLIDGDYVFSQADTDTPYQDVVYVTRDRGAITGLILVVALGLGAVTLAIVVASRRRRSTSHLPGA